MGTQGVILSVNGLRQLLHLPNTHYRHTFYFDTAEPLQLYGVYRTKAHLFFFEKAP